MTSGGFAARRSVIYLDTTPHSEPPMTRTTDPSRGRSRLLVPLLLCAVLSASLAACGGGGAAPPGAAGGPGDKAPEAVPVEVA